MFFSEKLVINSILVVMRNVYFVDTEKWIFL